MTTNLGLRPVPTDRAKGRFTTVAATDLTADLAAELATAGCERLVVDGPVPAGRSIDEDLRLLRFLREATCRTLRVDWTLGGRPLVEPRDLVHLVPPMDGDGEEAAECAAGWRADYRYGSYYYRQGPGFVTVKDVRPGGETVHLTIDGDSAAQFRALAAATVVADLDEAGVSALDDAVEYGLVLRGADTLLMLPFRMRRWPVPYSAI
jgi:hypothetical protein